MAKLHYGNKQPPKGPGAVATVGKRGNLQPAAKAGLTAVQGRGGDRKSTDFHMSKASHHIQKAIERRLSAKDK